MTNDTINLEATTPEQQVAIAITIAKQEEARQRIADLRSRAPHAALNIDETALNATPTPNNLAQIDNALAAINTAVNNAETTVFSEMMEKLVDGAKALIAKAGGLFGKETGEVTPALSPMEQKKLAAAVQANPLTHGVSVADLKALGVVGGLDAPANSLGAFTSFDLKSRKGPGFTPAEFDAFAEKKKPFSDV